MAGVQRQRIKSLYGEISGLFRALPTTPNTAISGSVVDQYNLAIDELSQAAETNYSRHKLGEPDRWPHGTGLSYDPNTTRSKMGSLVNRLEEEYGFGANSVSASSSPVIVTVNQNQEVTLSVTPIQQIIDTVDDEEVRQELENLKQVIEGDRSPEKTSSLLNSIQQKSWEVFIKVLPVVLEHLGQRPH